MIVLFLLISAILSFVAFAYLYCKSSFSYWKIRGVPYIKPAIPWGNLKENGKFLTLKAMLDNSYEKRTESVPFVGSYIFTKPMVVVTDLDLVKCILIKDFNCFEDRGAYSNERDDPLSAHLFSLDGNKWRKLRAKMTPTFSGGKMKYMHSTIVQVAERLQTAMEKEILETTNCFEIRELLGRYFTDVIGTCIFGIECNSLVDPDAEFRKIGREIFEKPRLPPILRAFTTIFPELARKFHIKVTRDNVSKFFMDIVRETIDYRERHNVHRNDFMDILIQLKNGKDGENNNDVGKLTFEEIAAQAFVFFLAGFETSAATMSFALYELMLNKDIQDRARSEISTVLNQHYGKLTYEAVNSMKYLDKIFQETLRKYPPVIFLIRKASQNYSVPNTNKIIEKGTSIFIPAECFQHDPQIYSSPDIFDPDRFSSDVMDNRQSDALLAFGDGPRNCIGLRFAQIQVKVGLAILLKNFEFSKTHKTQVPIKFSKFTPVLTPEQGIWVKAKRLSHNN